MDEAVAALEHARALTWASVYSLAAASDRREAFGALAHEWLGLYVYRRRGWID